MNDGITRFAALTALVGVCITSYFDYKKSENFIDQLDEQKAIQNKLQSSQLNLAIKQEEFDQFSTKKSLNLDQLTFVGQAISKAFSTDTTEVERKAHLVTIEMVLSPIDFHKFQQAAQIIESDFARTVQASKVTKDEKIDRTITEKKSQIVNILEELRKGKSNSERTAAYNKAIVFIDSPALVVSLTEFIDEYIKNSDPNYVNPNVRVWILRLISGLKPSAMESTDNTIQLKSSLEQLKLLSTQNLKHISGFGDRAGRYYRASIRRLDAYLG